MVPELPGEGKSASLVNIVSLLNKRLFWEFQ